MLTQCSLSFCKLGLVFSEEIENTTAVALGILGRNCPVPHGTARRGGQAGGQAMVCHRRQARSHGGGGGGVSPIDFPGLFSICG